MKYYIIRFKLKNKYYRSKNLLVHNMNCARCYSSAGYARKAAEKSSFSHMDYEIIEIQSTSSMNM